MFANRKDIITAGSCWIVSGLLLCALKNDPGMVKVTTSALQGTASPQIQIQM